MPFVVRMTRENCTCAIELLRYHKAGELMGQRHRAERDEAAAAFAQSSGLVRPAVGWADGENDMLRITIAAGPKPIRERLGAHLASTAIHKEERRLCAAALPTEPIKKYRFGPEGLAGATGNTNTTLEIVAYWLLVRIARSRWSADMGEGNLHGEENNAKQPSGSAILMLPSLSKSEAWVRYSDKLKAVIWEIIGTNR